MGPDCTNCSTNETLKKIIKEKSKIIKEQTALIKRIRGRQQLVIVYPAIKDKN